MVFVSVIADRPRMDIKVDVHTKRVLYRLGASTATDETSTLEAADGALWYIGRTWCIASDPRCSTCPLTELCGRIHLDETIASGRTQYECR